MGVFAQLGDLAWLKAEFAQLDFPTLEGVAAVGPVEQTWVLEACVSELRAVDRRLGPDLAICEKCTLVPFRLVELLSPLVHLHFPLESVAVLGNDAELLVAQIFRIVCLSTDMHQTVIVVLIGPLMVDRDARLARPHNQLGKRDSLLLVLPEEHLGERDQKEANHHQGNAMGVVSLIGWRISCILDLSLRLS